MGDEVEALKQKLSEKDSITALEYNQMELKLIQTNTLLENTEIELFSLRTELKNILEKVAELKEMKINIVDAEHCLYDSNIEMVSLLNDTVLTFTDNK